MSSVKTLVFAASLGLTCALVGSAARADDAKPAGTAASGTKAPGATPTDAKPKFTSTQIKAFLQKCSDEADAKGLDVKRGKGAERKVFRRECMHKLGVDPRQSAAD